jgi:hypothetical protein
MGQRSGSNALEARVRNFFLAPETRPSGFGQFRLFCFAPIYVIQSYAKPPPKPVIRSECGLARLLATIRIVAPATAEQNDATRTASLTCARTAPVVDRERPNKKAIVNPTPVEAASP